MAKRGRRDRARDRGPERADRPNRRLAKELGKLEQSLEIARADEAKRRRQLDAATAEVARLRAEMARVQSELAGWPAAAPEVAEGVEAEIEALAEDVVPVADRDVPALPVPVGLAEELARLDTSPAGQDGSPHAEAAEAWLEEVDATEAQAPEGEAPEGEATEASAESLAEPEDSLAEPDEPWAEPAETLEAFEPDEAAAPVDALPAVQLLAVYDLVPAPEPELIEAREPDVTPEAEPVELLEVPVALDEVEHIVPLGAGIAAIELADEPIAAAWNGSGRDAELVATPATGRAEPGEAPEPTARSWPQRRHRRSSG